MTDPYLGEVQIFGFNFAPASWAFCNGATVQVRQFATLFSLIGTQYGGDGSNTFLLPNLANRAPCSQGTGPGLTQRIVGETFGENGVSLLQTEMPGHTHTATIYRGGTPATKLGTPTTGANLSVLGRTDTLATGAQPNTTFAPNMIGNQGGSAPHENRQPFLALNYCIALQGVFPAFN
jgi:microcystin-dependent protein